MRLLLQYAAKQSLIKKIHMVMKTLFTDFAFNSIQRYNIVSNHLRINEQF